MEAEEYCTSPERMESRPPQVMLLRGSGTTTIASKQQEQLDRGNAALGWFYVERRSSHMIWSPYATPRAVLMFYYRIKKASVRCYKLLNFEDRDSDDESLASKIKTARYGACE